MNEEQGQSQEIEAGSYLSAELEKVLFAKFFSHCRWKFFWHNPTVESSLLHIKLALEIVYCGVAARMAMAASLLICVQHKSP